MWVICGIRESNSLSNFDAVKTRNFNWNTSLTLAHNKNEITRLSNDVYTTNRIMVGDAWVRGGSGRTTHVVEEGYPVGQFYGPEFVRIDENGKYVFRNKDGEEVNSVRPKITLTLVRLNPI